MNFSRNIVKFLLLAVLVSAVFKTSPVKANVEQRRIQILNLIEEELREVKRLNKQNGSRNASLLLRMAELLLEKARHIKEKENFTFLKIPVEQRRNKNKKDYFKVSRRYFIQAQKTCRYILKRFKKLKSRGNVYYILAYNSKEFQKHQNAEKYFKAAIKYSRKGAEINSKSKLALAEILFNKQKYSKAIPLYEQALQKIKDRWLSKDTYNLAWCYFRINRYTKAISKLKKAYALSKNSKYVDMSKQVERDLAYFYTAAGKTSKAVSFYRKIGADITKNLIKVSDFLIKQAKYSDAEKTLQQALNYVKNDQERVSIHMELLHLYDKFGNTKKHLRSTKILLSLYQQKKLSKDEYQTLKFHAQSRAALLQKQAASKTYSTMKKIRDRKTRYAVEYFAIIGKLNPGKEYMSDFHSAETNYNARSFTKALKKYHLAYNGAKLVGNKKIAKLSLDGLLASLGERGVRKETINKYLMPAYIAFVSDRPRAKENNKILQRLYSLHMDKKDIKEAEQVMILFKEKFPNDQQTSEAMLAQIMDHHRKLKNEKEIISWVRRINKGEFKVSRRYAKKVKLLLLTMQFDDIEKANNSGNKKVAMQGYFKIYKAVESSAEAKKNAAYNLATLFHQLADAERTYLWSKQALSMMKSNNVRRFESSFVTIATELFNRRRFSKAAKLNEILLQKLCIKRSRNKNNFFKNANVIYLANDDFIGSERIFKQAYKCKISKKIINEAVTEQIKYLVETEKWSLLETKINTHQRTTSLYAALIYPMSILSRAYRATGRIEKAENLERKLLKTYTLAKRRNQNIELEGLDAVAKLKLQQLKIQSQKLYATKLSFPENTYNKILQRKFSQLDKVTTDAMNVLESGSGEGIINSYLVLVSAYESMVKEITGFTPPGKSLAYVKGFQREMNQLVKPIEKKAREFRTEANRQISRSSILSTANAWFLNKASFNIKYFYNRGSVLMDRGGNK
jgi:tetratricopeptide (TPR) repeat protein